MGSVGIFWDIENCHPPSGMSGYTVAEKIKQAVRSFGCISVFKAYFDVNREATKGVQQHELQCSGVSLIHTPHISGKKDVADKVLLVDLMIFALQGNEKKTIVLIAGDQDYSYAISMLRSRGNDVFVISSSFSAHRGLGRLASGTWDWKEDVLAAETQTRRALNREFIQETSSPQMQPTTPLLSKSRTQQSSALIRTVLELAIHCLGTILHVALSFLKSSVKTCSFGSYSVLRRLMQPTRRAYLPKKDEEAHRVIEEVVTSLESSGECSQAEQHTEEPNETVKHPVSMTVSSGMMTQTSSKYTEISHVESTSSDLAPKTVEDATPLDPHHPSSDRFSLLISVLRKRQSLGWTSTAYNYLKFLLEEANPQVYKSAGVDGYRGYLEAARDANIVLLSMVSWEMERGLISLHPQQAQRHDPGPGVRRTETSKGSDKKTNACPSVVTGPKRKTVLPTPAPRSTRKPVDPKFRVLVDEMRKLRSSCVFSIVRGQLSQKLIERDSQLAARLGLSVRKYVNKAKQLGYILITPGKKGKSLVSLHPDYY